MLRPNITFASHDCRCHGDNDEKEARSLASPLGCYVDSASMVCEVQEFSQSDENKFKRKGAIQRSLVLDANTSYLDGLLEQ
mmetsp:Transcript_36942/g.49953  ORF Transcript_36942/g.49953 Transcript_36942/m.49953 type:complete len:81 (-) Transcript_36942:175-417(-)